MVELFDEEGPPTDDLVSEAAGVSTKHNPNPNLKPKPNPNPKPKPTLNP